MPTLSEYRTKLQRLLNTEGLQTLYTNTELDSYINDARKQVALEGQCVRALTPIAGPISSIAVGSAGGGYSAAQVVISAPDQPDGTAAYPNGAQATALASLAGTTLGSVAVTSGGAGYFAPVAFVSGDGSGANVTCAVSGVMATVQGQERYPFTWARSQIAAQKSGIGEVAFVRGISLIYGNIRYTLSHMGYQKYAAYVRNFTNGTYQMNPGVFAQFEQGVDGTVFLYPIPNQRYAMEWDVCLIPQDLNSSDTVPETIPYPWTEAVIYLGAYYAYSGKSRNSDADRMWQQYERWMKRARGMSQPGVVSSWYGRV